MNDNKNFTDEEDPSHQYFDFWSFQNEWHQVSVSLLPHKSSESLSLSQNFAACPPFLLTNLPNCPPPPQFQKRVSATTPQHLGELLNLSNFIYA